MSNSDTVSESKRCLGVEGSEALPKCVVKGALVVLHALQNGEVCGR